MPAVSASAVRDSAGKVHIGLVNVDPNREIAVSASLSGVTATSVTGRVLTAQSANAHNTFESPAAVRPAAFSGASLSGGELRVALPAKSVVVLDLQ